MPHQIGAAIGPTGLRPAAATIIARRGRNGDIGRACFLCRSGRDAFALREKIRIPNTHVVWVRGPDSQTRYRPCVGRGFCGKKGGCSRYHEPYVPEVLQSVFGQFAFSDRAVDQIWTFPSRVADAPKARKAPSPIWSKKLRLAPCRCGRICPNVSSSRFCIGPQQIPAVRGVGGRKLLAPVRSKMSCHGCSGIPSFKVLHRMVSSDS